MKKIGIALIVLGFYCVLFAFNMDVVVGTTYNIGLMNERQNVVYLSGIIFLAGIILFGFGFSAKEESKNFKVFAIACFLSPVLLLVGIKTVVSVQESIRKQSNIRRQAAIDAEKYVSAKKAEAKKYEREQEEQVREQNRQVQEQKLEAAQLGIKAAAKRTLEEYANEFTNNKIIEHYKVSDHLVRAAITSNPVNELSGGSLLAIEIKDSDKFSIATYTLEGSGGGNHYERYMIGFMKGKIIKPIQVGGDWNFSDRTIELNKQIIDLNGITWKDGDGHCCPSKPMTKKFEISENGFREITTKQ